jgi:DNA-binding transcriptional MocR family regulator
MSGERRAGVLQWLRNRRAIAVEDDYDAEYRYDRAPVGALQALEPGRIIYGGTTSKTLAPALRLGWLPDSDDVRAIQEGAARRGISIAIQKEHQVRFRTPPTLLLGYANISEASIRVGIKELAGAVKAVRGRRSRR